MSHLDFELLSRINVISQDDGEKFTIKDRIDVIKDELRDSQYQVIAEKPLFYLYGKRTLQELPEKLVVISTHIDCVDEITDFFTDRIDENIIKGTFDNSVTNYVAISLMLSGTLPENVIIAFTGDEERNSRGAKTLVEYLQLLKKQPLVISLDVTPMGFAENLRFTIENNYWSELKYEEAIITAANSVSERWRIVVADAENIAASIPENRILKDANGNPIEAWCDEAMEYHELGVGTAFSLCLPVEGNMHSNRGVFTRIKSIMYYEKALGELSTALSHCT